MCRADEVGRPEERADRRGDCFLADPDVDEARDLAGGETARHLQLEFSDPMHRAVDPDALFLRRLSRLHLSPHAPDGFMSITASTSPIGCTVRTSPRISTSVPLAGTSISTSAFSVSITSRTSPAVTLSPTAFFHSTIVASVIV